MDSATPLLDRALAEARTDWLSGDPAAWSRYADCLAQLERRFERPAPPPLCRQGPRPPRPGLRAPFGLA